MYTYMHIYTYKYRYMYIYIDIYIRTVDKYAYISKLSPSGHKNMNSKQKGNPFVGRTNTW